MNEDNMIIPAIVLDCCVNCNSENTIELFDCNGKPMNYQLMRRMNNYKSLNCGNNFVSYFRCTKCGTKYHIIWSDGIPYPLISNTRINNFICNFIKDGSE